MEKLTLKRMAAQYYQKDGQVNENNQSAKRDMEDITWLKNKIIMMKKAQVIIYAILNHFDKAVKIALECNDIKMAKKYANKPEDKKIRKKLWMKIAKNLFGYQGKKKNKNQGQISLLDDNGPDNEFKSSMTKYKINEAL